MIDNILKGLETVWGYHRFTLAREICSALMSDARLGQLHNRSPVV